MDNNNEIKIEKVFSVSKEQLYQAWTKEEELKQWWKPMGSQLIEFTGEVDKGGDLKYKFDGKDNLSSFIITGQYDEVVENEKLVYSWNWEFPEDKDVENNYKLTINFQEADGGSKLSILQENLQNADAVSTHTKGWEKAFADLESFLGKGEDENDTQYESSRSKDVQDQEGVPDYGSQHIPETEGHNEAPGQSKVGGE